MAMRSGVDERRPRWTSLCLALALGALGCNSRVSAGNAAADPLPSWNAGPAKRAIVEFVKKTTDRKNPQYPYGPAGGLPDSKVGAFPYALMDEAKKVGWQVVSMKNDWQRIFTFERLAI
jgi:hypothetical protein